MRNIYYALGCILGISTAASGQYCAGGPSSTWDSNVGSVSLVGESSNISYTGCVSGGITGLEDQTGSTPADMAHGSSYTVDIEWSTCGGTYGNSGEAWIDFNGNGIFESSESIAQWSGTPSFLGNYTFTVPVGAITGATRMRVMQQEGGSIPLDPCASYTWGSKVDFTVLLSATPITCPMISGLMVTNVEADSAFITWTPGGSETLWNVEYGPAGFTPGTGTSFTTTNSTDTITGLPLDDVYDVYVQANCGGTDTAFWVGPVHFHTYDQGSYMEYNTLCGTGFEDISSTGTVTSLSWDAEAGFTLPFTFVFQGNPSDEISVGDNGGIIFGTTAGDVAWNNGAMATATEGFYPYWDDLSSGDVYTETRGTVPNRRYIVQWEDYSSSGGDLTFQVILYEGTNEIAFNYADADNGSTWSSYGASATIGVNGGYGPLEVSYNQPYLTDISCINFYYTDCPKPYNLMTDYIGVDTVIFSWTAGGSETEWIIEWGPEGFTPGTGTSFTTTDMTDTITGLTQLTEYDIYVFASCSASDSSVLSDPINFMTEPVCPNPSFVFNSFLASDSAGIAWTSNGPETEWNIQYGPAGFNIGAGTVIVTTNNPDTLTGLTPGMVYDVYVQSQCSAVDTSLWIGPAQVYTPIANDTVCGALDLPVDGVTRWFHNVGATAVNEPGNSPNNTVWFTFTAPASGGVSVSTCGTPFDTELQIFSSDSCDGLMTSVGYADFNPFSGCSGTHPAGIELCGLDSGKTYYMWVGPWSNGNTGQFPLTITEIPFAVAGLDNSSTVCSGDIVDMDFEVNGGATNGVFEEVVNTASLNGNLFNTGNLAYNTFGIYYIVSNLCHSDTALLEITIDEPSNAGMDGIITSACNTSAAVNLMDGLTGSVDLGGTWTSVSGQGTISGNTMIPDTSMGAGNYDYMYIVSNGVCAPDTAIVTVEILDCVGLGELDGSMISLFPNPAYDVFKVEGLQSGAIVTMFNIVGERVMVEEATSSEIQISVSDLKPGTYVVQITLDNNSLFSRVVVK